jgi:hypothetical protein
MAGRQSLREYLVAHYGGDASKVWTDARRPRPAAGSWRPSIGDMKARSLTAILGKRLGVTSRASMR